MPRERGEMIEVEIDVGDVQDMTEEYARGADEAIKNITADILGEAKEEAPSDEGALANQMDMQKLAAGEYGIGTPVYYRWWVHDGTGVFGPHGSPLVPTQAEFMKFFWKKTGKIHYRKTVKGQEPDPFYDRAIKTVDRRIEDHIDEALGDL